MKNQDRTQSTSLRNRLFTAAGIIGLAALTTVWWFQHFGPGYDAEFEAVRTELQEIPGVEIIELTCVHDKDIPLLPYIKNISARIEVKGAGEMVFTGLSRDSFHSAEHIGLRSLGDTVFRYRRRGYLGAYQQASGEPTISEGFGGSMNIGREGEFAALFPFEIPDIQTAVERYGEISKIVNQWPESPLPPQHFQTESGVDYYHWIVKADEKEAPDPLWNIPFSALQKRILGDREES